ncbi:UDP-GalNAc:beta-1,3-N-acetylgalactosaminyltransferase 2-like [Centruroides vittatus]|uniref:UDP-GalNAc:beta-1, 3-N-acetylgalactosaminyltransferase 2-like n=1 Tax=Centruroides vittatus TaxID=120091 RepID=UPI00350FFC86
MWKWTASVVLLSFVLNRIDWTTYLYFFEDTKTKYDLIVGILSSRSNFQQREAIRKTWLSILNNSSILNNFNAKAWFIVGNRDCPIPVEYRLNDYDCQLWEANVSDIKINEEFSTEKINIVNDHDSKQHRYVHQGFSFQVNYPIIIRRLGVLAEGLLPNSSVKVTLLNGPLKEIVVKTVIDPKGFNTEADGFLYRSVTPYLLPKRFEGVLLVEGVLSRKALSLVEWNNGSGLITFQRIYKTADDSESTEFDNEDLVAPSMTFVVSDRNNFLNFETDRKNVINNWKKSLLLTSLNLQRESETWNDIYLVDVTDVYRNLPVKLLKFLNGIVDKYKLSAFLKTDDDCFIHIPNVVKELRNPKYELGQNWWWSRFRRNWIVNYFGKWKDFNYASFVYPAFPCGGGYVLSSEVVNWIAYNENALFPYQGEDVSVGIWLSATIFKKHEDDRWNCEEGCQENSFNRVQLSNEDMYKIWNTYISCGNICHC